MPVTLTARYDVRPDGDVAAVHDAVRLMVGASRAEPGCLLYEAYVPEDDARAVVFLERYVDEAAVEAHRASPHFTRYVAGVIRPQLTARTVTVLHPLGD